MPDMEKKPTDRLKLDISWQEAAGKLIRTPAKSAPPRAVKRRKVTRKPKR